MCSTCYSLLGCNMASRHTKLINEVYYITHYKFQNESLLLEVFTPPYLNSRNVTSSYCFERLEFLGDSVLNLVISIILFDLYPMEAEGDLTLRKNDLVSGRKLTEVCRSLGFMKLIPECPAKTMRRESDTMEALIGAIFLDGGFNNIKEFIVRNWKKRARQLQVAIIDPKSKLYIWAQKRHLPNPVYKIIKESQLDIQFKMTLQLKDTHGLGIVKVTTDVKKQGELDAARAMLARIQNREKWKTFFRSEGDYITEEDLMLSSEDIKRRLYLWCLSHDMDLPQYKVTQGTNTNNNTQITTLVTVGASRGAYGVSTNEAVSEKKAALKMLLRFCDEEREQLMFAGKMLHCQIDLCLPKNFKSLVDEWVTKNHLGRIEYNCQEISKGNLYDVSLTIPKSDLGVVYTTSYKRKLAEHKAAALMIERIVTRYNDTLHLLDTTQKEEVPNYKNELHIWTNSKGLHNPVYTTLNVTGLKHSLLFTVSVSVKGRNTTIASDYTKRQAQQKAAEKMIKVINGSNL